MADIQRAAALTNGWPKLDLARAYIDMGDPDGARSILDEVMEEGSDNQKDEARDIMAQMS